MIVLLEVLLFHYFDNGTRVIHQASTGLKSILLLHRHYSLYTLSHKNKRIPKTLDKSFDALDELILVGEFVLPGRALAASVPNKIVLSVDLN